MANRTDPSSLSFGRLLRQTAELTNRQQREIEALKESQLSSEEKTSAQELAKERRAERLRAKQMLASFDTTLDELDTLNQALLTPALRDQLRHNRNSLQAAEFKPVFQLGPEALLRIQNWRETAPDLSDEVWAKFNAPPEPAATDAWKQTARNFYRSQNAAAISSERNSRGRQPLPERSSEKVEQLRIQQMKKYGKFLSNPVLSDLSD